MINEDKKENIFEVYPTKKIKRVGVFFADFFVFLILSVLIFEGVTMQIVRPVTGLLDKMNSITEVQKNQTDIFYENKILFYKEDEKYSKEENYEYTCLLYTSNLLENENTEDYDIFKNFFIDVKHKDEQFIKQLISSIDNNYFFDENISFKQEYKNLFAPLFDSADTISTRGQEEYNKFYKNFFIGMYAEIGKEIENSDLVSSNNYSYKDSVKRLDEITLEINNIYIASAISTFVGSSIIYFVVLPLILNGKKTLCEYLLHVERIDTNNFSYLSKKMFFSKSLIDVILNLAIIMFIPLMELDFRYLFYLTPLLSISVISLIFIIINFIVLLINSYNKSIKEIVTNSIVIDSLTYDNLIRAKNNE